MLCRDDEDGDGIFSENWVAKLGLYFIYNDDQGNEDQNEYDHDNW